MVGLVKVLVGQVNLSLIRALPTMGLTWTLFLGL